MKIVRPIEVTDTVLTFSNVPETDYAAWASGTTYALGDRVLRLAANVHQIYESAAGSNVGHDPLTDDGTHWTLVGADNRWSMFDAVVQSQTTHADAIDATLAIPGRIDTVALLNLSATAVEVTLTDATDGVVYDKTFSLVSPSGITDWYAYFLEPIERLGDLILTDLPAAYANATLDVSITESGATVACGVLIPGLSKDVGGTQYGASLGIVDYSVKTADEFGNFGVVKRAFSRQANFQVFVANSYVDKLINLLSDYRATPILYIGDDDYTASAVYGFYKDFTVAISYPDVSVCSIELEGLT